MDILEFLNGRKEGVVQSVLEKFKTIEGTCKPLSFNFFVVSIYPSLSSGFPGCQFLCGGRSLDPILKAGQEHPLGKQNRG